MKVCIFSSFMKMICFILFNILEEEAVESRNFFPLVVIVIICSIFLRLWKV